MSDVAVWFDLDGTLLAFDDYGAVVEHACVEMGIDPTDAFLEAYYDRFFDAFRNYHPDPFRAGVERAVMATGSYVDAVAFVDTIREAEFDAAKVPEAVHDALAELEAADGVALGVLTNGLEEWQRGKLEANELLGYFDATLTSYEVGRHKPAPEVFARAEKLLPADEHVMVGDDDEADVAGARERGWRAIHVDGPESVGDAVARIR
ncbi:HAD family hydrolase [Halorarum halophilum]|uniref:HAD family hydrolase n=1 Tax=Halorarum halophilum TaxID=2743090 RepID=A0A7D5GLQ0_9EURY|nr:HAD family hydrolase [Halobaculum halophilum]QLG28187.1 HAD family hydrolase [Halobaculum halophilum]